MQQALGASDFDATAPRSRPVAVCLALEPACSSLLARIAETIGSVPQILLQDSEIETGPGPIVKPSSPEMPDPAERPDRYQLFGEIARGGMGAILRGRDVDLGRDLAVKVLLEGHKGKPDLVRRFVEEAQISGQLQHPGIVPVYELGSFADRRPYFTMKLVKGHTLAELLRARSSPAEGLPRFLSIFESIAQTMAYSHARGVIHRDLKPSNVMVGSFGEVQVMDWGLAKVLPKGGVVADEPQRRAEPDIPASVIRTVRSGSDADASQAGSVLGTPGYMAPEQARGEIEAVDERADVFGLGAILCEILTGEPAFVGRSLGETLRKAGRGELAEAFAGLEACGADAELIGLAKDCLAPEREDRPGRAGTVAERITAYLTGVQEKLRTAELARVEANARAEAERKRQKLTLALAALIMALMTVGVGGAAVYVQQRRDRAARLQLALLQVRLFRDLAQADPTGNVVNWRSTSEALKRAEDLLGPLSDAASQREVLALRDQVAAARAAAERTAILLRDVAAIRNAEASEPDGWVSDTSPPDGWDSDKDYARAFRYAGVDVDALGSDAAAARIRAQPAEVVRTLAAALDDWAVQRRRAKPYAKDAWLRLSATASAVDPDPTRVRLRQLWSEPDRTVQRETLRTLAQQADLRGWPAPSLTMLAGALAGADEREAAVDLLRRAQARHPGDVWVNHDLARYLEQLHPPRTEEAIRFYSVARALRPETAHELAHALQSRGSSDEAVLVFRDLTQLQPGNNRHWICLARLLEERGDHAGSEAALEKSLGLGQDREAIRLHPNNAQLRNSLAWKLLLQTRRPQHEYSEALVHARKAVELAPKDGNIANTLALAEYRLGHWAESIAASGRSIELLKDVDASNWFFLAMAHWQKGDKDEARKWFDKAVEWTKEKDAGDSWSWAYRFWSESAGLLGQPGPYTPSPGSPTATAVEKPH
jgi:serine/threonine-protein kinase